MRKKFLGLAIIAISLFAFDAVAQTTPTTTSAKQENVKMKKFDRTKKCENCRFEGLNLTADQQTKLQQLDSKLKAERKAEAKERKEMKQRNDSLRKAERRMAKKEYLEEVKAIIGPDKYVLFLENMYINGGDHYKGKASFGHGKDFKQKGSRPHRDGKKGDKRFDKRFDKKADRPDRNAATSADK